MLFYKNGKIELNKMFEIRDFERINIDLKLYKLFKKRLFLNL